MGSAIFRILVELWYSDESWKWRISLLSVLAAILVLPFVVRLIILLF